jgi:hypothetical protein
MILLDPHQLRYKKVNRNEKPRHLVNSGTPLSLEKPGFLHLLCNRLHALSAKFIIIRVKKIKVKDEGYDHWYHSISTSELNNPYTFLYRVPGIKLVRICLHSTRQCGCSNIPAGDNGCCTYLQTFITQGQITQSLLSTNMINWRMSHES